MTATRLAKRQEDIMCLSKLRGEARELGKMFDAALDFLAYPSDEQTAVKAKNTAHALDAQLDENLEERTDLLKRMNDGHRQEIEEARKLVYLRYLECLRNAVGEPERGHWKPDMLERVLWSLTDMLRSIEQEHGYAALDSVVPDQATKSFHQWNPDRGRLEAEIARLRPHASSGAADWLKEWCPDIPL